MAIIDAKNQFPSCTGPSHAHDGPNRCQVRYKSRHCSLFSSSTLYHIGLETCPASRFSTASAIYTGSSRIEMFEIHHRFRSSMSFLREGYHVRSRILSDRDEFAVPKSCRVFMRPFPRVRECFHPLAQFLNWLDSWNYFYYCEVRKLCVRIRLLAYCIEIVFRPSLFLMDESNIKNSPAPLVFCFIEVM
jgi:hypothetical protein